MNSHVEQPSEPGPPGYYCNAKNRQGEPCSNRAGYATDHVGRGRCKFHGGSVPVKHGLYSQLTEHRLGDRLKEIREIPDEELLDLRSRIALQSAVIEDYLSGVADRENVTPGEANTLVGLVEKASKNIARLHKMEHGERQVIRVEHVEVLIARITAIIETEVGEEAAERIGRRILQIAAEE